MLLWNRQRVDLAGRLSNPDETIGIAAGSIEFPAGQGLRASRRARETPSEGANRASDPFRDAQPEDRGRLSNPVQRRLSEATVDELVEEYLAGSSIDSLANDRQVNRTTVMGHLERRGVERRRTARKLTDGAVSKAAARYESGESLKIVAVKFDVDARTLAREFRRTGVRIRPRRGWPPSDLSPAGHSGHGSRTRVRATRGQ
jgi:hypothetical protein